MPDIADAFEGEFFEFLANSIRWQKRTADRAMAQFIGLRLMTVVASALLPALTTLPNRGWAIGAAVLVAALTGLDTQFRWGEEWHHFRSTQLALERMNREYKYRALSLAQGRTVGRISKPEDNFDKLFTDVEELLQSEADGFFKFRITRWQQPEGRAP
jgi:hypothetical protein